MPADACGFYENGRCIMPDISNCTCKLAVAVDGISMCNGTNDNLIGRGNHG